MNKKEIIEELRLTDEEMERCRLPGWEYISSDEVRDAQLTKVFSDNRVAIVDRRQISDVLKIQVGATKTGDDCYEIKPYWRGYLATEIIKALRKAG